jgi:hypothetical protein
MNVAFLAETGHVDADIPTTDQKVRGSRSAAGVRTTTGVARERNSARASRSDLFTFSRNLAHSRSRSAPWASRAHGAFAIDEISDGIGVGE